MPDLGELRKACDASIDLRLGSWFLSLKQTKTMGVSLIGDEDDKSMSRTTQHFVKFGSGYVLHPGAFVLGSTLEWLALPSTISGHVTGKSSLGRHGLVIETASGIHPSFSGCLTLELANVGEVPLKIYPGMPICQIFFHRVEGATNSSDGPSGGQFSGSRRPSLKTPRPDNTFQKLKNNATIKP
jgi:dCTP deaminase